MDCHSFVTPQYDLPRRFVARYMVRIPQDILKWCEQNATEGYPNIPALPEPLKELKCQAGIDDLVHEPVTKSRQDAQERVNGVSDTSPGPSGVPSRPCARWVGQWGR